MPPKQLVLKHDPSILLETLHEDDDVLAIAKPFGVLAHPSPGFWTKGTLAHALVGRVANDMMQERGNHNEWDSFIPRCIVHRLDAGTTGVMVVAKSPASEKDLAEQLRAADMQLDPSQTGKKLYVALLLGHPGGEEKRSCITASGNIGRDPKNGKMWAVTSAGKPAKTIFRVHASSKKHGLSLVTAELFSGRTRTRSGFMLLPWVRQWPTTRFMPPSTSLRPSKLFADDHSVRVFQTRGSYCTHSGSTSNIRCVLGGMVPCAYERPFQKTCLTLFARCGQICP